MSIYLIIILLVIAVIPLLVIVDGKRRRPQKEDRERLPENFEDLLVKTRHAINEILNADISQMKIGSDEIAKRRQQQAKLRLSTRQACLGDNGAGEYLKEYIKDLLQNRLGISPNTICRFIPFNESARMTGTELFEFMYMIYRRNFCVHVFSRLVKDFGLAEPVFDEDMRPIYAVSEEKIREAYSVCKYEGTYTDMLETLTQRCFEKLYGHDVADLLIADEDIDGVSGGVGGKTRVEYNYFEELLKGSEEKQNITNSYDVIYCVYRGKLIRMQFLSFGREETLERVVKNIYRYNSKTTLSKRNPVLNASFKNNSRIVVARPPVSDSWSFFVRKFASTDAKSIESLIIDKNADRVIELLKLIVKAECNFVISGNTGGGKTTLLKALIGYINPSYALRVIESSFELNINNLYPERNVHVMQERGDFSVYDAITASKKMDTDVLILGEVNEPKLAGAFIQVAQSGSRMAITTLHHETTTKLVEYLRNALVSEFGISDVKIAEAQVVNSISFDVHMIHDVTGHHYIERITQIVPLETSELSRVKDEAQIEFYERISNPRLYEVRDIVVFDKENFCYKFVNEVYGSILNSALRTREVTV